MYKVAPAIYSPGMNEPWGYYIYDELVECVNKLRQVINKTPLSPVEVWERFLGMNPYVRRDYASHDNMLYVQIASANGVREEWSGGSIPPSLLPDEQLFVPVLWGKRVLDAARVGAECARRAEHHGRLRSTMYYTVPPTGPGQFA